MAAILFAITALHGQAAQRAPAQSWDEVRQRADSYLQEQFAHVYPGVRAQVQVGEVDRRLYMPKCTQFAFSLPAGSQLFGPGTLGVRCTAPSNWSLYLTYSSILHGPALVARRPLLAREPLAAPDVEIREVRYERPPGNYLRDPTRLDGVMIARPTERGEAITLDRITRQPSVRAGQKVKVVAEGSGFSVSHEGVAQNTAQAGDMVRVKTDSGRIIQGQAAQDGRVIIKP